MERPQKFLTNIVIVEKSNKNLRICLDPMNLNKVIIRNYFLIPTLDEIRMKLCNKNRFFLLDLKSGFWQIKLDKESSDVCTFSTPFGFYKFKRLSFGISCSPEEFEEQNQKYFSGIKNVKIYFFYILIATEDKVTRIETVRKVLKWAKELNIKFIPDKFIYKQKKNKLLRHDILWN